MRAESDDGQPPAPSLTQTPTPPALSLIPTASRNPHTNRVRGDREDCEEVIEVVIEEVIEAVTKLLSWVHPSRG